MLIIPKSELNRFSKSSRGFEPLPVKTLKTLEVSEMQSFGEIMRGFEPLERLR